MSRLRPNREQQAFMSVATLQATDDRLPTADGGPMAIHISGAFVYQPTALFDVVLVVVDDDCNPAFAGEATLSLAVVLGYPDDLPEVQLDLLAVTRLGNGGGLHAGASWPGDPQPADGWAPAALLATVTTGYTSYSAVITAALPAPADTGIAIAAKLPIVEQI
jgi:hypothetical protein